MPADASCPASPGQVVLELTPTQANPRNSEGAFVTLRSGSLAFYYTQYYGGNDDHSAARIVAIESTDGGFSWGEPRVILEGRDGLGLNIMSVSIVRMVDGRLALFYIFTHDAGDARPWLCFSENEGATWSRSRCLIGVPGYYVLNNDRAILTRSNRLVLPMNQHDRVGERGTAIWYYSDDDGMNWRQSPSRGAIVEGVSGLQESGAVELADASLLSWARTDQGCQYEFRSTDGGRNWGGPFRGPLVSPLSPASIKRIPHSADLLAIYNDHSGDFPFRQGMRTPLVAAVSRDGGISWPWRKLVEGDVTLWYHYTAIHFTGDALLLAYNAGDDRMAKFTGSLRIRRINGNWLKTNP